MRQLDGTRSAEWVVLGMPIPPSPQQIFERSLAEGRRRLHMRLVQQISTGFLAGVTITFGIVALAVTDAEIGRDLGPGVATVAGSMAFGVGLVLLIVGRSELFSENFLEPVAAAFVEHRLAAGVARLARLWAVILVLNVVGGAALAGVMTVPDALPEGSSDALMRIADEIATKGAAATLARAVLAGALITLLSYLLSAVDTVLGRMVVAYLVGVLLALGPFDHVAVSVIHLLFGIWLGDGIGFGYGDIALTAGVTALGNLVGGLLFITVSQVARARD
jgi:formate-nitrite transporter family protein